MKKYKVKINGKMYNVELEAIEEVEEKVITENNKEKVISNDTKDCFEVLSPIQGNVINVLVSKGQKVKKGDVLLIIEAMKLENEVNSISDGEVVDILVEKGQSVANNQLLVKIK